MDVLFTNGVPPEGNMQVLSGQKIISDEGDKLDLDWSTRGAIPEPYAGLLEITSVADLYQRLFFLAPLVLERLECRTNCCSTLKDICICFNVCSWHVS